MNSYNKLTNNNISMDDVMESLISKKEENKEDEPHILHIGLLAKNLYVNDGVELPAIYEMFKKHITLPRLFEFKETQHWDKERVRLLKIKNTLYGNAKQLVKMTLAVAKVDPTANNIGAYKRAIESLIVLKKLMPAKKTNKDDVNITPEHIAEFAGAAGLDYLSAPPRYPASPECEIKESTGDNNEEQNSDNINNETEQDA